MSRRDPSKAQAKGPFSVDPDAFPNETPDDTPSWVVEDEDVGEEKSCSNGPFFVDPNDFPDDPPPPAEDSKWVMEGAPEQALPDDRIPEELGPQSGLDAPPPGELENSSVDESLYIEEEPKPASSESEMDSKYISIGQPEPEAKVEVNVQDGHQLRRATWVFVGIGALCGCVVLFALILQFAVGGGDVQTPTTTAPAPGSADIRGIQVRTSLQAPPQPDPLKERLRELEEEEAQEQVDSEEGEDEDEGEPEPDLPKSNTRVPSGDPIRD